MASRNIVVQTGPEYVTSVTSTDYLSGAHTEVSDLAKVRRIGYSELIGENIPNYHKRLKSGELLPHTVYSKLSLETETFQGIFTFDNPAGTVGGVTHQESSFPGPWGPVGEYTVTEAELDDYVPSNIDNLVDIAAARIYSKGHDTATALAELHQLRNLATGIATRWIRLADAVKDKKLSDSAKRMVNLYLEGRYGWRPLKADIQALDKAIREFDSKRHRYSENVKRIVDRDVSEYVLPLANGFGSYTWTTTTSREVSLAASVTADIQPPRFAFNPAVTVWELTTLSFALDWFIAVGTWLEAMSFLVLVDKYYASSGYLVKITKESVAGNFSPNGYGYTGNVYGYTKSEGIKKARVPATVPSYPQFRLNLDAWKIADLLALLVQRIPFKHLLKAERWAKDRSPEQIREWLRKR